jgi:predicted DCC family thiol-disulfide oxidoreductase YuxK
MLAKQNPIIFYDGLCGLCDSSVQFIIKNDKKKEFRFSSLQSTYAENLLGEKAKQDSFILFINGNVFDKSTAVLKVCKIIGGPFLLLYPLILIPSFIRDGVYGMIAKNRYRWFGKFDSCKIPTPYQQELFFK